MAGKETPCATSRSTTRLRSPTSPLPHLPKILVAWATDARIGL
jgi:hypothetical protein